MSAVPPFDDSLIESIARVLGDCGSGSDIARSLRAKGHVDDSGESTKWRKLDALFRRWQSATSSPNQILAFAGHLLAPARFVGQIDKFEQHRQSLNVVLAFAGIEYGDDGGFRKRLAAKSLSEAEARVRTIRSKFAGRRIHDEVLRYCRVELLQDNYFRAVFEATKGLAERIRDMSKVQLDGAALVDQAFLGDRPLLAFNSLQTATEQSQHKGFAALLKGCFAAVRNPLAHEPKILWEGEDDAADYLSLILLLHRKLDVCVPVRYSVTP